MPVIDGRGTRPVVQSGDKAFVEQKEREGKLKSDTGLLTTTGDLATLTAGAGKDMFVSEVTCAVSRAVFTSLLTRNAQVDLKVNGVVVESYIYQDFISSGESKSNSGTFEFKWRGKVSTGQIIKLEVITLETDLQATGMIQCYEESSGSQTIGGQTVTFQTEGGDLSFLRDKERAGDLVKLVSSEFSTDADQITFVPSNGKTFFFTKAKLYPVVDTMAGRAGGAGFTATNRRADIEITNDGVVIDVLTHDSESWQHDFLISGGPSGIGQYESNIFDSLVGDGIKEFKLISTNTSGTYRVSLFGWLEDT